MYGSHALKVAIILWVDTPDFMEVCELANVDVDFMVTAFDAVLEAEDKAAAKAIGKPIRKILTSTDAMRRQELDAEEGTP